jgi:Ca-activated chloride channel family protein
VGTVALGGTMIGDAIRKASESFQDEVKNYKVILLITDGEDQESLPKFAAEKAKKKGIHIFTIGLGSEAPVPIRIKDEETGEVRFVTDEEGTIHNTRLDVKTLTEISEILFMESTGTEPLQMEEFYEKHIATLPERERDHKRQQRYTDRYQYFLLAAIAFFMIEPFISTRRRTT